MNSNMMTARILGVSFLLAFVTGILGMILSGLGSPSFIESTDLLHNVSANSMQMRISILIDLIASASVVALGVMLFVSLKDHHRNIALLGLGLFLVEATMLAVSRISVFSLLQLSREYVEAGAPDSSHFHTLGNLFVGASNSGYLILQFFFSLGALMFYFIFYKSKLIPRFLSVWGLIAMTMWLAEIMLETLGHGVGLLLGIPTILLEPFIGIWLIVKGFNSSIVVSQSTT